MLQNDCGGVCCEHLGSKGKHLTAGTGASSFFRRQGVEGAELHRFRKTFADTLHEEGVSVNTIRIRLGHESLDVTLAYLKGKDAESEEAQEHANSSSLALYA
jgi:integrase